MDELLNTKICVHIHILHNIGRLVGQNKISTSVNAACQGNLSGFASTGLCPVGLSSHENKKKKNTWDSSVGIVIHDGLEGPGTETQ